MMTFNILDIFRPARKGRHRMTSGNTAPAPVAPAGPLTAGAPAEPSPITPEPVLAADALLTERATESPLTAALTERTEEVEIYIGRHRFVYENETLRTEPLSPANIPVIPGEDTADVPTEVISLTIQAPIAAQHRRRLEALIIDTRPVSSSLSSLLRHDFTGEFSIGTPAPAPAPAAAAAFA